jgi:hypothetical protein
MNVVKVRATAIHKKVGSLLHSRISLKKIFYGYKHGVYSNTEPDYCVNLL